MNLMRLIVAKSKVKKPEGSEISLNSLFSAVDNKDYGWWNTLTLEQQNSFNSWLFMRYISSVQHSDPVYSMYYLRSVNEHVNKNFNAIRKHPQLVYLLMCASSPGLGTQRHNWVPPGKQSGATKTKKHALLSKLYPLCNATEIDILAESNSKEDLIEFMLDSGCTDKEINEIINDLDE